MQPPDIGETWFEETRQQTGWLASNARPGGLADAFALAAPWSALKAVETAVRQAISPLVTALESHIAHPETFGAALDIVFQAQAEPGTPEAAVALYERIAEAGLTAAIDAGGSVAHHYGVGRTRRSYFARERGPEAMLALQAIKNALDPNGVLRPI